MTDAKHEHCWHALIHAPPQSSRVEQPYVDQCCWCGLYRTADGHTEGGHHGPFAAEWDSRIVEISHQVLDEISRAMRGRR